jgi:hypothetical protein
VRCPECASSKLTFAITHQGATGIADGRHCIGEVKTIVYLGCDWCSETIWNLNEDEFLELLNSSNMVYLLGLYIEAVKKERAEQKREAAVKAMAAEGERLRVEGEPIL